MFLKSFKIILSEIFTKECLKIGFSIVTNLSNKLLIRDVTYKSTFFQALVQCLEMY